MGISWEYHGNIMGIFRTWEKSSRSLGSIGLIFGPILELPPAFANGAWDTKTMPQLSSTCHRNHPWEWSFDVAENSPYMDD
jgi:hypothetical protein